MEIFPFSSGTSIFYDEVLKNENIMVILCGSAMSFMEKEILSKKSAVWKSNRNIKNEGNGFL